MKSTVPSRPALEVELKLALPTADPAGLARRLARLPVLARRKSTHQLLHNVYFDTPAQVLRRQSVALRLRRLGSDVKPQWLQTLKIGGRGDSALSRRGEWEVPVPGDALARTALKATPWSRIDPDGAVFEALVPCFETHFERTRWTVRRRDGSVVEVALDLGHIAAGDRRAPLCELELELLAGQPAALFDLARQIASTIAVLPASQSKSERGYALAQGAPDAAIKARPPKLKSDLSLAAAAARVLREMFSQFSGNLNALCRSDDPEVVHQARVGWRRLRSALRLFKPVLLADTLPSLQALQPLLGFLGQLRDLDVAGTDTLPPLAAAYVAADTRRAEQWQVMAQAVLNAATLQRKSVRYALQAPEVGAALLAMTQWLEALSAPVGTGDGPTGAAAGATNEAEEPLRRWSRRRMARLNRQLKAAARAIDNPNHQHQVRILAKRLRYGVEALRSLLPKRLAKRWYRHAVRLQLALGAQRDLIQAGTLVAKLEADRELVEFLRGVGIGRAWPSP